jgi:hypothetical protein
MRDAVTDDRSEDVEPTRGAALSAGSQLGLRLLSATECTMSPSAATGRTDPSRADADDARPGGGGREKEVTPTRTTPHLDL